MESSCSGLLAACRVGLASGIGADFPYSCKDWLDTAGIDRDGLLIWPFATLRAWQVRCNPKPHCFLVISNLECL
jgi:hypothetical protein